MQRQSPAPLSAKSRWWALILLCMGALMIVIDMTIVNVALPSIGIDLGFSQTALVWVVNAYTLTFGGFLLLGGRLGDLYGQRRVFLIGIVFFTITSLVCGLAVSQGLLVAARALQGVGGAIVDAVALSLIVSLFTEPGERAKAMGIYGFVCAGGGSIGVLLGGLLTNAFSWHWIFLVNLPIGIAIFVACLRLLPADAAPARRERLDVGGAVTITAALMVAVYAVIGGNDAGWTSPRTLALFAVALVLLGLFLGIEARTRSPLVPLRLFRRRNIVFSNIVGILWSGGMFAWFFIAALYLQGVLGYDALEVGLAFLPANILMAVLSLGVSAWLVGRFGVRLPLAGGLVLAAIGLALFARAPIGGDVVVDVLPGMLLLGAGAGIAFNPLLLAAMSDVSAEESGLASGIVNTGFMMGGALGLAVLASVAAARSESLLGLGAGRIEALNGGYQVAFLVGALFTVVAAALGGIVLRQRTNESMKAAPSPQAS